MGYKKIDELAQIFESTLVRLIGGRQATSLADFPNHSNVGDSAIYLGELAALNRISVPAQRLDVFDLNDFSKSAYRKPQSSEVILIHGGGNFGDLWPMHQKLRNNLLEKYRECRIIQFPQSIHFDSHDFLRDTQKVIASHSDFHLMVRDKQSERLAKDHFDCSIHLVPDAAFSLRSLTRTHKPSIKTLCLLRTDKEKIELSNSNEMCSATEDWLDERSTFYHNMDTGFKKISEKCPKAFDLNLLRSSRRLLYGKLAEIRVRRGLEQLCRAETVITDRLHAFILCVLLGVKCSTGDNSYGKINNLRTTWGL